MGSFLGLIVQKDQAHIVLPLLALPDIGTEGHLICNSLVESLQSNRWTQVADTATPGSQLDATATQVPCIIQDQAKQAGDHFFKIWIKAKHEFHAMQWYCKILQCSSRFCVVL